MATRVGVDVGGTFTDLIFYDDTTGEVWPAKVSTTSADPVEGVASAIAEAIPPRAMSEAAFFIHATTVPLNALLERKGPKMALLCTRGFRDVLESRRGDRGDAYNLFWNPPSPLVSRRLRIPITERITADGAILTHLDEKDVFEAAKALEAEGIESVAIAFLHSYVNPAHEIAAAKALREAGYRGELSLSHEVSGEYREYERTSTTIVDAFVRPRMANYLKSLGERVRATGFRGKMLVTRSGGGAMTFEEAGRRPVETVLSGPAAGAEGAAELARRLGLGDAISIDVGGTSFDTCFITGDRPPLMYEGSVVGLPVQVPWVDLRTIGAGGGSIAYVDRGGLMKVGPRSAGAQPGPACYDRGGTAATVTDAALVLGMLGQAKLSTGLMLKREKAEASLLELAGELGLNDIKQTARGILTIVTSNMANAIREITIEQGHDPRTASIIAFGGAGPLFATLIARELGIREIVVPPHAGNFSAWGLLGADITRTAARTRILKLTDSSLPEINRVLAASFETLGSDAIEGSITDSQNNEVALDLRFVGQEHSLTVPVPFRNGEVRASIDEIRKLFVAEYTKTFGHALEDDLEVVVMRATARTPLPPRTEKAVPGASRRPPETFDAYSFTEDAVLPFQIVPRMSLSAGDAITGPAIVLEQTATTYLDVGFSLRVGDEGSLLLTDKRTRS
ncbi:MAG: hydantoinase/oxoprolinase family protein [Mesorhizobium sp.]|uniref:hydantoinase/oxoprolinase family protein n=1 Tax=Mesorhizobium sp. TaxID=1871066 RepID=UPI000FE78C96|nr:hydantoinase/oxoprolinase family protein [Mesorhizobium sp.]RWA88205.1 MAG: hydantoinase/oxoprolinase family protein [Mesorhizobium sp.]RWB58668.1 MAG: hydantoinase/oxoprolinase family protein [Mesorhizobium sp.]TIU35782.1 MAG: hydantoinase/oxoprolinase family protein [Mesorhizobium sp.]